MVGIPQEVFLGLGCDLEDLADLRHASLDVLNLLADLFELGFGRHHVLGDVGV